MKIIIPDLINLNTETKNKLKIRYPDIEIYEDTIHDSKTISERIKNAQIVTANFINLTAENIDSAPQLKYIISPASGYDWIDIKRATQKGIKVLNCPTYNSRAVAEHAIALMFAVKRNIVQAHISIQKGAYNSRQFVNTEVGGKLLVTIGHGNVGTKIIEMATGLGMKTQFADSKTSSEELDTLISKADVLVLCLTLNDNTKGLIDKSKLSLMKKDSILINVARGLIVDYEALYETLKNKEIAGAGIDTFTMDEILTEGREDIIKFANLPNVVATPHIGFNTAESATRLGEEFLANIESCLTGTPINVVN